MKYPKGHEFELRALRPSQINVDELYQRKLKMNRVKKIVEEFNGDIFNEPKVSYRDGKYWVFNGQHSLAAWRMLFNGEDKPMPCKVYKGMTWLDECNLFIAQNGISKDPTTVEKLNSAKNSHRPDVEAMVNGAELVGFKVNFDNYKSTNTIVAVVALFKAFHRLGAEAYVDMLTAIREAWNGDPDSLCTQIITGMAVFYETYAGHFKRTDLVASLKRVTPAQIIRSGKTVHLSNKYAREIAKSYNLKRRNRLDLDEL